jgi:hypothetical protein
LVWKRGYIVEEASCEGCVVCIELEKRFVVIDVMG